MVILKIAAGIQIHPGQIEKAADELARQAENGVLLLPSWCELVAVTESSAEVQIITGDRSQAELEAELAAAMAYISELHDCVTCAHENEAQDAADCLEQALDCQACPVPACACRYCYNGSAWKWRGAHGKD